MTRPRYLLAIALGGLAVGCGPVEYLAQVSGRATNALAQAKREGADAHAPYEYTLANEYLTKAREDAGRSSYQTSLEYGHKAEEHANRALALTRQKNARRRAEHEDPGVLVPVPPAVKAEPQ